MSIVARSEKCPSCGGNLVFDTASQKLTCGFCGGSFDPKLLDLASKIEPIDQAAAGEEENSKTEVVCDSCGAVVITDNNTSATFCAFCGSPSLITKRLSREFRPDCLIPFKINKEDAKQRFISFAKSKKYVPNDFFDDKNIGKITGLYVPFWLLDARCKSNVKATYFKYAMENRDKYRSTTDFGFSVKNVPFDGAKLISDELMEAIEPFDTTQMVPFNTSFLQGFYAQRYDLSTMELSNRIMTRLYRYAKEIASYSLIDADKSSVDFCTASIEDMSHKYALFPVWFLNYKYKGILYSFAVNGQTGKVDGFAPISDSKKALRFGAFHLITVLKFAMIFLGFLTVVGALIWTVIQLLSFIFGYGRERELFEFIMIMLGVGAFMLPVSIVAARKADNVVVLNFPLVKTIRKMVNKRREKYYGLSASINELTNSKPPASEYYDTTAKTEFKSEGGIVDSSSIFEEDEEA